MSPFVFDGGLLQITVVFAEIMARFDGDPEFLGEALQVYKAQAEGQRESIRWALAHDDDVALARAVHKFKGTLGVFSGALVVPVQRDDDNEKLQPPVLEEWLAASLAFEHWLVRQLAQL